MVARLDEAQARVPSQVMRSLALVLFSCALGFLSLAPSLFASRGTTSYPAAVFST